MKLDLKQLDKEEIIKGVVMAGLFLFIVSPSMAQGTGGIGAATDMIKEYWAPLKLLIQAIGGIVGIVGAVRIYNKWTNGDHDINKELVSWGGAALFLVIAPQFINSFFSMT